MTKNRSVRGWDEGAALAATTGGSGKMFRLENDGDRALVVFDWQNAPYCYQSLFRENEGSLDLSTEEGEEYLEEHPAAKKKARFRARIGLFVLYRSDNDDEDNDDDGDSLASRVIKKTTDIEGEGSVWEVSQTVFTDISKLRGRRPFDKWVFEVERRGSAGDKKTTYSILHDCKIEEIEGLQELLESVEWADLEDPFGSNDGSDSEKKPGKREKKEGKRSRKSSKGKQTKEERAKVKEIFAGEKRALAPEFLEKVGLASPKDLTGDLVEQAEAWVADKMASEPADDDDFFDD